MYSLSKYCRYLVYKAVFDNKNCFSLKVLITLSKAHLFSTSISENVYRTIRYEHYIIIFRLIVIFHSLRCAILIILRDFIV